MSFDVSDAVSASDKFTGGCGVWSCSSVVVVEAGVCVSDVEVCLVDGVIGCVSDVEVRIVGGVIGCVVEEGTCVVGFEGNVEYRFLVVVVLGG